MTLAAYHDLIARKRIAFEPRGFTDVSDADLPASLFDHQKHGVEFGLRAGCAAEFYDTGLGKTAIALAWGQGVIRRTNKPVLMLAPLAVGPQHVAEAERLGIETKISRFGVPPESPCIAITNYERLERFDPADYAGVILDESSILKSFTGKTTRKLIEAFAQTPYRLACTATPAPNDHSEIGTHSAFLGVMARDEMLSRWFIHDSADTGQWRIKGHAAGDFWRWVASWARCVGKPSDLGFSDEGFELPPLNLHRHVVEADRSIDPGEEKKTGQGLLFRIPNTSATSIHKEKRLTKELRAKMAADIVLGDSACGSLNTQSDGGSAEPLILTTEQSETPKGMGEIAKSAAPICDNGAKPIANMSPSSGISQPKPEMSDGERDTRKTSSTGKPAKRRRRKGALSESEMGGSGQSSASVQPSMIDASLNKKEGAQSADHSGQVSGANVSPSITVIRPEECAGSSVRTATKDLGSSATTPSGLGAPQTTSRINDWWVIWCDTDYDQDELERYFGDAAISIRGSMSYDRKEELHAAWLAGERMVLITKASIFGFGLNWQHCCRVVFCGINFSYESFYQAIRRCWRYKQKRPVDVHIICADTENAIWEVVSRKADDHGVMKAEMAAAMREASAAQARKTLYLGNQEPRLPAWMTS